MKVLGYGEDALTLWALTNRCREVLRILGDGSDQEDVALIYRPSFGRKGGPRSSQFGEFDFILGTTSALYLGEAKWDKSPELQERPIKLRDEQRERHKVFAAYYRTWVTRPQWQVSDFLEAAKENFAAQKLEKPIPPAGSILARNLISILTVCAQETKRTRIVRNVLLVTDSAGSLALSVTDTPADFTLAYIRAAESMVMGLIPLGIK